MFFFLSPNPAASLENHSSPASGCDWSPSFDCGGGYLSSDSIDVSLNRHFARVREREKKAVMQINANVKVLMLILIQFIQLKGESFSSWH